MSIPHKAEYLHHQNPSIGASVREFVFGMEDGMVSTLGAVTGIAAATNDRFTIFLAGFVLVAVESLSMAVGSYLSSKSERAIDEHKLKEEQEELVRMPLEEKAELVEMYVKDGWPAPLATAMAETASQNKKLFLQEMAYRELKIIPDNMENPLRNGTIMGFSYIFGGAIPLVPYIFLAAVASSLGWSIGVTLLALFILGVYTTKFSHRAWWRAGGEMVLLASIAAGVGYGVGQLVSTWLS